MAEFVGERHQNERARPRLDIFLRRVDRAIGEARRQHSGEGLDRRLDADLVEVDAKRVGAGGGVDLARLGGIARRHHHRSHPVRAQRIDRDHRAQG